MEHFRLLVTEPNLFAATFRMSDSIKDHKEEDSALATQ